MKGVILGGGKGSRLYPLTYVTNKHLLPIYNKPMIFYPIETLVNAGVTEILLVTGGPFAGDYIKVLKNGNEFGIKHLEYAYQEEEGGISQALSLARDFADNDSVAVILGDNTTDADISEPIKNFTKGSMMFLKKVPDPERFGVPVFDSEDNQKVVEIEEKPSNPKSNYASTGLYLFDNSCFTRIKNLKPSARGELEITDLQNSYIKDGLMKWAELKGFWSDAGTFESFYRSNKYWAEKEK